MVWMCFIVIEPFVKFRKDRVEDVRVLPQRKPDILCSSVLSEFVNMKRELMEGDRRLDRIYFEILNCR